jgi:cell division protein FtsW
MASNPHRLPLTWKDNPAGVGLILTTLALLALGVVMVHSALASVAEPGPWRSRRDIWQTIYAVLAAVLLLAAWRVDYHRLVRDRRVPLLLLGGLVLALITGGLVYVPGLGHGVGGRLRWIQFQLAGVTIRFQPSELIKLAMVIFLAGWLTRRQTNVRSFFKTFVPACLVIGGCVGMVIREDFGTGMLISIAGMATLFLAGVPIRYLVGLAAGAGGAFAVLVRSAPYRWARMMAMIDPWDTANRAAYHARQSLLTIMNGGYFGLGLGRGMLKRGFLPEGETDFIFSVFCEEWGLVGALLLVGLILAWMWHARRATLRAGDAFGRTLAGSLGFEIAFQAVLHMAVDLVAAPPTGVGCPFISLGGTRLLTMSAAAALIVSVSAHRPAEALRCDAAGAPDDLAATPAGPN